MNRVNLIKQTQRDQGKALDQFGALYSMEAEKSILGSILAQPEACLDEVTDAIQTQDFFVPAHQTIFETIKTLSKNKSAIDLMTVHQYLVDQKRAQEVGSPGILAELLASLASHLNIRSHIKIVRDKSILRHLQQGCITICNSITDDPTQVEEILGKAEQIILGISHQSLTTKDTPFCDTINQVVEQVKEWNKNGKPVTGIPSGLSELDRLTTGWQGGQMIVVGARPGVGKTAAMLSMMHHIINPRHTPHSEKPELPIACQVFSMEMKNHQLARRLLSMESGVRMQGLRTGRLRELDHRSMELARRNMQEWPLYIDDQNDLDINQLRARARRAKKKKGIQIVFIDYLQLIRCKKFGDNRQQEVAEISRGIKGMAMELDVPVVVLAQLNRRSLDQNGAAMEPTVDNLRESGAIEQDADVVLLPHNTGEKEEDLLLYDFILAKQRDGPLGKIHATFDPSQAMFSERRKAP